MLGCGKCAGPTVTALHDTKPRRLTKICDKSFELRVEVKPEDGITIMHFRYPQLGGRVALVTAISITQVGDDDQSGTFCHLRAKELGGPLIASTWVVGTVPENYVVRECYRANFGPGDYTVVLWTDRGEVRRRMHVEPDGQVEILNWDDLSEEECEARLERQKP
jgi:hypothetical protein